VDEEAGHAAGTMKRPQSTRLACRVCDRDVTRETGRTVKLDRLPFFVVPPVMVVCHECDALFEVRP
jgi:hypothetical protein